MIEQALEIDGWMSHSELEWLARQARMAAVIIEFGCYKGRSTRVLGDNTPGIVYAVDPWDGEYKDAGGNPSIINTSVKNEFVENLKDLISRGKVVVVQNFSWSFIPSEKADLIFIDGDHRYEEVLDDIKHAMKFINRGGIIAGHDYIHKDWPGVKKAVDEMFPEIDLCDSIWSVKL